MSTDIADFDGLTITQFCGPERPNGGDRRMYQISDHRGEGTYVQVTAAELARIARIVRKSEHP